MSTYLLTPSGAGASTPDVGPNLVLGTTQLSLRVGVMLDNYNPGVIQPLISQYVAGAAAGSRFWFGINASGQLEYRWYNSAGGTVLAQVTPPAWTAGSLHYLWMTHALAAGQVTFSEGTTALDTGATAVGAPVTGLATTGLATTGTAPVIRIGHDDDGHSAPGKILNTEVVGSGLSPQRKFYMDWTDQQVGSTGPWLDTSALSIGETWTAIGAASIGGVRQIRSPAVPPTPDITLGCGIARAEIRTRGGASMVLDLPNITSVEWGRVQSDTSDAAVEMDGQAISADPACCAVMTTVRPWLHELWVYRDAGNGSVMEWSGPITEIELDGPKLTIKARDLSTWYDHRFIHSNHQYGGTNTNQGSIDAETIFLDVSNDAWRVDFSPIPGLTDIFTLTSVNATVLGTSPYGGGLGTLVNRTYSPGQFKAAGGELRDLAKNHLSWTVAKRQGYLDAAAKWIDVFPNPVVNPTFEVNSTGWTGHCARTASVFHSGVACLASNSGLLDITGSMVGLTVNERYLMTCWMRGTSSALDAATTGDGDGVIKVGNDESDGISWALYGQALSSAFVGDNPGRDVWVPVGVFFTATATTMPITIMQNGGLAAVDSNSVFFDDFHVWQMVPSFTLHDNALASPPKITLSGLDQSTRTVVATKQGGTDGDVGAYAEQPKPAWNPGSLGPPGGAYSADELEFGLLETMVTSTLNGGASTGSAASQHAAMLSGTPIVLDGLTLSPTANVTMDQLIPGCMFLLRLDEPCFAIAAQLILQSVSVKTTPTGGEQVSVTFQPTGF